MCGKTGLSAVFARAPCTTVSKPLSTAGNCAPIANVAAIVCADGASMCFILPGIVTCATFGALAAPASLARNVALSTHTAIRTLVLTKISTTRRTAALS